MNTPTHQVRPDHLGLSVVWMNFFIRQAFELLDVEQQEQIVDAVGDMLDEEFHPQIEEAYDEHVEWAERNLNRFTEGRARHERRLQELAATMATLPDDHLDDRFHALWRDSDAEQRVHLSDMVHLFEHQQGIGTGWTPWEEDELASA